MTNNRLPISQKLSYGLGAIAYAVPYQIMASFFLFYVTAILHISPLIAGVIVALSVFWDAITDPLVGYISDRTQSERFGRRHLYLILGGIGTAIGSYLMWSIPPESSELYKVSMVVILILFTKTTLTLYGAPYFAIGATMSDDYDERSKIQSYRATFHIIGMIIALVGSTIVFFKSTDAYPKGQLNPEAYPAMGLAIGLVTLVIALLSVILIPRDMTRISQQELIYKPNVLNQALNALKDTNFKAIIVMIFLIEVGFQISISMGFHVSTYVYNLKGPQIGILGLTVLGFSILSQPFWVFVSEKLEKKTALYIGMIFVIIGFSGNAFVFVYWEIFQLNQPSTLQIMIGFGVLAGIGNGVFMTLPFSMVADSIDQGELESGERQEGLFFGLYNFAYKAGISVSILISGVLLEIIGFDSTLDIQTDTTIYNLAMVPTWLLIIVGPFTVWALYGYRINRKKHKEVLSELKKRNLVNNTSQG